MRPMLTDQVSFRLAIFSLFRQCETLKRGLEPFYAMSKQCLATKGRPQLPTTREADSMLQQKGLQDLENSFPKFDLKDSGK